MPIREIGKVVIAKDQNELIGLEKLYSRGLANEVELEMRPAKDLKEIEPLALSNFDFLWSPTTAVSDPIEVTKGLAREFISLGGLLKLNSNLELQNGNLIANDSKIDFDHFVNCSGGHATEIAKNMGFASDYRTMPFLGTYKQVDQSKLPIKTLIYPVPHPVNPFLGVHLTLTIEGKVKIGPTAIPVLGNEQYDLASAFSYREFIDYFKNIYGVAKSEKHDIKSIAISEFPNLLTSVAIKKVSRMVPAASSVSGWSKKRPGIRSQLINSKSGELVQDFIVEGDTRSTHVLNAVSPGWTAAIPFGHYIAKKVLGAR